MKKKLLALVCALALTFSFAGCTISTPDTVGSIGDLRSPPACICWPSTEPISRRHSWPAAIRMPRM